MSSSKNEKKVSNNDNDDELNENSFDPLNMFYDALKDFVSQCLEIWPDCDATKQYLYKLELIKDSPRLLDTLVKQWHQNMTTVCWKDKKNHDKNLYDAVDIGYIAPFETCTISILNKFKFLEKLQSIRENPNKKEVAEEERNILKHIKKINTYSRMLFCIQGDLRKQMQQTSVELSRAMSSGEKVDLRPIAIGEKIIKSFSSDKSKQDMALDNIIKNIQYLQPALNNMKEDMGISTENEFAT